MNEERIISETINTENSNNTENPTGTDNPTNKELVYLAPQIVSHRRKSSVKKYLGVACLTVALCGASLIAGTEIGRHLEFKAPVTAEAVVPPAPTNAIPLSQDSNNVASIFKAVEGSVVSINTKAVAENPFYQFGTYAGAGSGIVYGEDESKIYIVTNNHVIEAAQSVTVSFDGKTEIPASFVGNASESDLAVISLNKADVEKAGVKDYSVAAFGDSDKIEVGENVMAIGNALGEGKSITSGIISAKNKILNIDGKELNVIQTDAAINPGNSGGALVNASGKIIGINTAKYSSAGVEGMGYSIPSNLAKQIADEIIANGSVQKPRLGIKAVTVTEEMKEMYGFKSNGVLVAGVESGSPAEKSGMLSGDIIVGIGETKISTLEDLQKLLGESKVGDSVKVYVNRDGIPVVLNTEIGDANQNVAF